MKGGSALPLLRGDEGGIRGKIYLQFDYNYLLSFGSIRSLQESIKEKTEEQGLKFKVVSELFIKAEVDFHHVLHDVGCQDIKG